VAAAARYHAWLADVLGPHLRPPVLEIGSGLGTLAQALSRWHQPILASEADPALQARLHRRFATDDGVEVTDGIWLPDVDDAHHLRPRTVVLSNVLEHIVDDAGALAALHRRLASLEQVLIVVPAHEWVRSPLDDELGHIRRYERAQLLDVISASGWHCDSIRFFNPIGAIAWAVSGRVFRRTTISRWQTNAVETALPLLKLVDAGFRGRVLGQSLIARCQR
jgi:hypothetical protein